MVKVPLPNFASDSFFIGAVKLDGRLYNFSNLILFDADDGATRELRSAVALPSRHIDFTRIVYPPQEIDTEAATRSEDPEDTMWAQATNWNKENWGSAYNAGWTALVERDGNAGISFCTLDTIPAPVLRALAAKHPNVSWQYYGCTWSGNAMISGRAASGEFTFGAVEQNAAGERDFVWRMVWTGDRRSPHAQPWPAL